MGEHGTSGARGRRLRSRLREGGNPVLSTGVVLLVLALLLVIAGATTMGDLSANPRFGLDQLERPDLGRADPSASDPPSAGDENGAEAATAAAKLLVALTITVVLVGIVLLVRGAIRGRFLEPEGRAQADTGSPLSADLPEEQAQALRVHLDEARDALERSGGAPDAMIRCWLALERAALAAGGARKPHQTPSEFTAAVLLKFHTDPDDTGVVLRLYQRARFAAHAEQAALTEAELAQAERALRSLCADIERNLPASQARQ